MGVGIFFIIIGILAMLILGFCLWCAVKPEWLDRNWGKIFFIVLIIGLIQTGIYCWRMPSDIRVGVIPKLNNQIEKYDALTRRYDGDVQFNKNHISRLEYNISNNGNRIDLLSEIEERRVLLGINEVVVWCEKDKCLKYFSPDEIMKGDE